MQRELEQAVKTKTKQQVMEALLANKIELPKAAVTAEINRMQQQAKKCMVRKPGLMVKAKE